jgi:hypothetical protein
MNHGDAASQAGAADSAVGAGAVQHGASVGGAERGESEVKTLSAACEQQQQQRQRQQQQDCVDLAMGWRVGYKAALHKCVERCEQLLATASAHSIAV